MGCREGNLRDSFAIFIAALGSMIYVKFTAIKIALVHKAVLHLESLQTALGSLVNCAEDRT